MNPLEKFLMEKKAADKKAGFFGGFRQQASKLPEHMGSAVAHGVSTAVVGAGMAGIGVAAGKIYDAMTKRRDFNSMLQANPDLVEHHEGDPKRFNMMFTSLRAMNPQFSADPLIAGNYMRRMVENPMTAGGIAVDALSNREKTDSPILNAFSRGGVEGAKGFKPEKSTKND